MSVGINKVFYLFIISIIFSSSCTFKKRLYNKGFYAASNYTKMRNARNPFVVFYNSTRRGEGSTV